MSDKAPTERTDIDNRHKNKPSTILKSTQCEVEEWSKKKKNGVSFLKDLKKRDVFLKEQMGKNAEEKNSFGCCQLTIHQVLAEMS